MAFALMTTAMLTFSSCGSDDDLSLAEEKFIGTWESTFTGFTGDFDYQEFIFKKGHKMVLNGYLDSEESEALTFDAKWWLEDVASDNLSGILILEIKDEYETEIQRAMFKFIDDETVSILPLDDEEPTEGYLKRVK